MEYVSPYAYTFMAVLVSKAIYEVRNKLSLSNGSGIILHMI